LLLEFGFALLFYGKGVENNEAIAKEVFNSNFIDKTV
jgi:hypothetical protein